MSIPSIKSITLLALLASWSVALGTSARRAPDASPASPRSSVTEHTILVNGRPLRYRATAGYLPIESDTGQPLAEIFFVAYERDDDAISDSGFRIADSSRDPNSQSAIINPQLASRPLLFAFNGGPGASSVWLHLGGIGPQRAILASGGTALPASEEPVDNDATWLEFADLVFVDPVGTGFSRPAPGVNVNQFYEVHKDIEVATEFIRLFVTQHGRWLSPQYIVGESYGTTRAVGVARRLQDRCGLYLRGLILLSSALDLQAISFDPGNDLPYVLSLPSYTAVAFYQGKLPRRSEGKKVRSEEDRSASSYLLTSPRSYLLDLSPLDRVLQEVEAWALADYLPALAKGASLSPGETRDIAARLAGYTGLRQDVVAGNHLRISAFGFTQDLLRGENRLLGLLDGRVTAPTVSSPRRTWTDPSLFLVAGPFVTALHSYLRADLGFQTERPYIFLSDKANESWNWGPARQGYLNVAPTLAESMSLDNRLRVFAAAGYYDLTTPYLGQQYVFNHLDLPPTLRPNLAFHLYPAGHQIYTSLDALRQLTADVRAFVTEPPSR